MSTFQLVGIDDTQFEPLFHLSDEQLRELGAVRRTVSDMPGFPCRVNRA